MICCVLAVGLVSGAFAVVARCAGERCVASGPRERRVEDAICDK